MGSAARRDENHRRVLAADGRAKPCSSCRQPLRTTGIRLASCSATSWDDNYFDAPPGFDRRIFLSFGSLPSQLPVGIRDYNALAEEFKLPTAQLAAQFESLAAMKALVQALQQAGAALSRERLIEQLETFHEYRTGFAPPLSFGPNRRVGANGAYVVTIDLINKKLVPVSDWVEGSATSQSDL